MVEDAIKKAEVLVEALNYVRRFRHRPIVIKLGGSCMEHHDSLTAILQDIVFMETVGMQPIVVHGGGKDISEAMRKAGLQPRFVHGRRYTDEQTLQIVIETLVEEINYDMVNRLRKLGGLAIGIHHGSVPCVFGEKMELDVDGEKVDLGRVGRVTRVDAQWLMGFCKSGIIPVIPSLALDPFHEILNVNGDTAAAAIASLVKAEKLVFVSDTPGILHDPKDENSLIRSLTSTQCRSLIKEKVISGGMIPKVEACLESLEAGVGKTHMVDGRVRHSLLLEIYTNTGIGTEIVL
jgi:acetylglutamate kinase